MAFRNVDFNHLVTFNSSASSEFIEKYETYLDSSILNSSSRPSHKTFAPSSFRCDRRSWFRLRGVEPDVPKTADRVLQFSADIGTACHRIIQTNLKDLLQDRWLDVSKYLNDDKYKCEIADDGLETRVSLEDPPVRFSVDGLLNWYDNKITLLEIKSAEFSTWNDLCDPKDEHIDQVKFYATLLNVNRAFVLYIDRQYGGLKCFEVAITAADKDKVWSKVNHVLKCVEHNIAPDPLPKGDKWCSSNMCNYYKKCSEYGRW